MAGVLISNASGRPALPTGTPPAIAASATPLRPGTAPSRSAPAETPATPSPPATPTAGASASPDATGLPISPGVSFSLGGDPEDAAAIAASVDRLGALDAYRFETAASGRSVLDLAEDRLIDFQTSGALRQEDELQVDATLGFRVIEANGTGATSTSQRVVLIGDDFWISRPGRELHREELTGDTLGGLLTLLPEELARRVVAPFAGAYARSGEEELGGASVVRYDLVPIGADALERALALDGSCESAIWIDATLGHLARTRTQCTAEDETEDRGFFVEIRVDDPNDPDIEITPPT